MYYSVMYVGLSSIVIAQRQGIARNFAAGNFMWFSVFSNLVWAVSTIFSCYLLISKGSVGRSLAFFIGYITNTLLFIPFYINKKLIEKELLLSKEHLLLLVCIIGSNLIFVFVDNIFLRIIITIASLMVCLMIFKIWFKNYIKNG